MGATLNIRHCNFCNMTKNNFTTIANITNKVVINNSIINIALI